MSKIVIKFGGSNLKNIYGIEHLYKIIKTYDKPVVVVVSALFGVTSFLEKKLPEVKNNSEVIDEIIDFLSHKNDGFIEYYFKDENSRCLAERALSNCLSGLRKYLTGINCISDIPDFLNDLVLSYGERLSSLLITIVLQKLDLDCREVLPENMPLLTTGEYGHASVNLEQSAAGVRKALEGDKTIIVPGFYGVSQRGKVTLLGRGGTDYSAACIARCLNASSLDIWKDVNGFMSADPSYVKNAVRHTRMSFTEAAELAYFGANILHPQTVEPLYGSGISIRLFDSRKLSDKPEPLTIIDEHGTITKQVVKSISFSNQFGIVKIKGPGVGIKRGILAKIYTQLDNNGINISSVITSQVTINLLLSKADLSKAERVLGELELAVVTDIVVLNDISIIAVVGKGMLEMPGVAARIFNALARKDINILISSLGASHVVTYLTVHNNDLEIAVNEIHDEFLKPINTKQNEYSI